MASGGPNNNGQRNSKSNLTRNQQPTLSKLMKAPQSSVCNMCPKKTGWNKCENKNKPCSFMNMTSTSISSPAQTLHETACRHGSHPRRQTIPPPATKKIQWVISEIETPQTNKTTFHLLENPTNRGSISQPAICSVAQESSAVFSMRTPKPINSSTEIPPPEKQQEIYTYKLCDICFSYQKKQIRTPASATSWWAFFLFSLFNRTKGGLCIWYLRQVSGWWIFEPIN